MSRAGRRGIILFVDLFLNHQFIDMIGVLFFYVSPEKNCCKAAGEYAI